MWKNVKLKCVVKITIITLCYIAFFVWYKDNANVLQAVSQEKAQRIIVHQNHQREYGNGTLQTHSVERPLPASLSNNRTHASYNTIEGSKTPSKLKRSNRTLVRNRRRPEYCNPTGIIRKNDFHVDRDKVSCKPVIATEEGCKLAERYHFHGELKTCDKDNGIDDICKHTTSEGTFKCDFRGCKKHEKPKVVVWRADDNDTGKLKRYKLFDSERFLERSLGDMSAETVKKGYGFLILQCVNKNITSTSDYVDSDDHESFIGQLLLLPPMKHNPNPESSKGTNKINVNIVLLDSLSRSHFYRSLPKTLEMFEQINLDRKTDSEILDFELFQAVNGHTKTNLRALFTGKVFPVDSMIGIGEFFRQFVANGYRTYYQDDMCYKDIWGLRLNVGKPSRFEKFKELLKENHIHSTGKKLSCCPFWLFSLEIEINPSKI